MSRVSSTFDLITLAAAASHPLVAFCLCNLIIAILLVATTSKPTSDTVVPDDQQQNPTALPGIADKNKDDSFHPCPSSNMIGEPKHVSVLAESPFGDEHVVNEDCEGSPDEDDHDNEADDELRRRVEEFIDKVNRGWRAEQLRLQASCH